MPAALEQKGGNGYNAGMSKKAKSEKTHHHPLLECFSPDALAEAEDFLARIDERRQAYEVSFGENVEEIGLKSFTNCKLKSIKIPSTIKLIDQAAFAMSDLEEVYFEGGNVKVCDLAFGKCKNLKKVYVPDCGITFEGGVFSYSDDVTIYTPSGSTAEEYANDKGIKVENE